MTSMHRLYDRPGLVASLFFMGFFVAAACLAGEAVTLHVAPDGDDRADGSFDAPFATISRARDEIRVLKSQDSDRNFTVLIRGGTYTLREPVVFTPVDSAADGHTITYQADGDERPVFSSGVALTGWQKVGEDPAHLAEAAKGRLWVADFPEGVTTFTTLFDAQGRLPRAIGGEHKPQAKQTDPRVADSKTLFFPAGSMREYENVSDVEIWIVPSYQWCHHILPLESVEVKNLTARTTVAGTYPLAQRASGHDPSRFRVCNVPDVLDGPGQWFMDSSQRKVWLWPRDGQEPEGVVIPVLNELFAVLGDRAAGAPVSGLVFDGLTFKHAKRDLMTDDDVGLQHDWEFWDKANALFRFRWTRNCVIRNSLLTESGGGGIRLDLGAQGNRVENCEVSYLGGTGIALIGDKIGEDFVNRNNTVHNNNIHHIGLEHHHSAAIMMWQSGENQITHNRVHHTPYNGFSIGGIMPSVFSREWRRRDAGSHERELARTINWEKLPFAEMENRNDPEITEATVLPYLFTRDNLFAYNDIYRTVELLGDGNPFYIRMAGHNNAIRRNYLHNTLGSHAAGAMRFDGEQAGTLFEENVIFRTTGAAVVFAKANRVVNNIMVDIRGNAMVQRGGTTVGAADIELEAGYFFWAHQTSLPGIGLENYDKTEIRKNVMVQDTPKFDRFYHDTKHWEGLIPHWSDFRKIQNTDDNLMWAPHNQAKLEEWLKDMQKHGLDRNSIVADPLFVDAEKQDFRFRPDSPALKMGIKSVDRRQAGLTDQFPDWLAARLQDDVDKPMRIEGLD
jgi:hypothetical protein